MQEPDLEAARQFEIGDEDLHVADKEFDEHEKRMTGATFESTWSQGSYRSSTTLRHTEPPLPKWDTSAPVPTLMLASRDSTHTRSVSDSSTMVADEVARGLSEVVLSPPSRPSKGAPVRPPRPPSLAMSVTRYYFEA
ncbi:uncharacterized protein LAESUDRAFT_344351 [Laetiporus sulphureus 93-53]|uniref:Uncharacterized protein n=1 Tax=Laetiporus sulphureus 93-53 TaxID=1314785 RepID=A0A165GQR6_9APHY|nr:uncharacterized protein LAESUDRAFT_344351 [Laetiporus sulphureus 93-53]KZT10676.1 hypothetical protein LAESUDRAFT_344351 [Laetiporus sulphureus 93-53]